MAEEEDVLAGQTRWSQPSRNAAAADVLAGGTVLGPSAVAEVLPEGSVLMGRYRLGHCLGQGGMGAVYEATDELAGLTVALKTLRPELSQDPEARQRFLQEFRITIGLHHPHIVRVDTIEQSDGLLFFTMELLAGETLRARLRRGPLDLQMTLRVLSCLAEALDYAHERTVHRDLKPENVFVLPDGEVKLTDFGIAKALRGASARTQAAAVMGSPYYVSPEQLQGAAEVDQRTDLYSLGVMLYEMLTAAIPVLGSAPLKERLPTLPVALTELYGRLVCPVERRLSSSKAVLEALSAIEKAAKAKEQQRKAAAEWKRKRAEQKEKQASEERERAERQRQQRERKLAEESERKLAEESERKLAEENERKLAEENERKLAEKPQRRALWPWVVLLISLFGLGVVIVVFVSSPEPLLPSTGEPVSAPVVPAARRSAPQAIEVFEQSREPPTQAPDHPVPSPEASPPPSIQDEDTVIENPAAVVVPPPPKLKAKAPKDDTKKGSTAKPAVAQQHETTPSTGEGVVSAKRAFFYSSPESNAKTGSYVIRGDRITFTDRSHGYVKVRFEHKGHTTRGWLRASDLSIN